MGRREGGRWSPWEWRDTGTPDGGPDGRPGHPKSSLREERGRARAEGTGRGKGGVVRQGPWWGHTPEDPRAPFYQESQGLCWDRQTPEPTPTAPNPPSPHPDPKPGLQVSWLRWICQGPTLPCATNSPGPWGHIPAAAQGKGVWRGHSDPPLSCWRFPTEQTPFPCPGSSARAGNCFPRPHIFLDSACSRSDVWNPDPSR